jgi:hypothetical protein
MAAERSLNPAYERIAAKYAAPPTKGENYQLNP